MCNKYSRTEELVKDTPVCDYPGKKSNVVTLKTPRQQTLSALRECQTLFTRLLLKEMFSVASLQ